MSPILPPARSTPRLIEFLWAAIATGLLAVWLISGPVMDEPDALCETDSECALHCPPPADDPDCDGGPQT